MLHFSGVYFDIRTVFERYAIETNGEEKMGFVCDFQIVRLLRSEREKHIISIFLYRTDNRHTPNEYLPCTPQTNRQFKIMIAN